MTISFVLCGLALAQHNSDNKNKDGSVDLYFGHKAAKGKEKNWISTNKGEGIQLFPDIRPCGKIFGSNLGVAEH